jgi:hypothetical protein
MINLDSEGRKNAIIKKYGSLNAYEQKRAKKTRETVLAKCKTEEERVIKLKKLEKADLWRNSIIIDNIGKTIICTRCGEDFIAGSRQHLFCRKCVLAVARIENAGSLEEYYEKSKKKEKDTMIKRYGDPNFNNRKKAKETCIGRFGVEHQFQVKEVIEKSKQTKLQRYGNSSYNNIEKTKDTNRERYGVHCTLLIDSIKEKIKKTKLTLYGDENYNNRVLYRQTCNIRFGGDTPFCDPSIRKKANDTLFKNYNVSVPLRSPIILERYKETNREKYGVDNYQKLEEVKKNNSKRMSDFPPMGNFEYVKKMIATTLDRYGTFSTRVIHYYDNNYFDSSWELAYYIYLQNKKIPFLYKPTPISYTTKNGRKHIYHPDFFVNGRYIEIKGDHLISKEGILIDYSGMPLIEKTKCLSDNNVTILTGKDIAPILEYVTSTFGKNFIFEHRVPLTHKQDSIND